MIPQISGGITQQIEIIPYPNRTFRFIEDKTAGFVDDIEAIKQAIYHILMTERYAYEIYDDNYGSQLQQYTGKPFSFLQATIQNTLRDALIQDDRITNIAVTNITKPDISSALVEFTVYTNIGAIETEAMINV